MSNRKGGVVVAAGRFQIVCYSAGDFSHAGLAVASARAGAAACIDAEFSSDRNVAGQFRQLLAAAAEGDIGVRFGRCNPLEFPLTLQLLATLDRPVVVLSAVGMQGLAARIAALPLNHQLLIEISDTDELESLTGVNAAAIIAVGNEAGGFVGEDASFILFQKLLKVSPLPIIVRGGIGVNNSAAFRVAGAAGVVLDDQLLLLKESPLPAAWRAEFEQASGQDTSVLADRSHNGRCRVLLRPRMVAARALDAQSRSLETGELSTSEWIATAAAAMGWGAVGEKAWPLGQAFGLAKIYRSQYRSVGRLLAAIESGSSASIRNAVSLRPLSKGSPLAVSHGTSYPIVQGPMTRVSDSAKFAKAVAEDGALPFLALALMKGEKVAELLQETEQLLGDLPWGVGLLGFVPHQLRQEQIEEIWKCPPDFALIAGGRPDQAIEFERRGIPAYIHVPAPELLELFLQQGARRFVFEGRECGGHIGPLASTVLWESMIESLLQTISPGTEEEVHVLFAGGLHDAVTGAMLSAMTAPLAARGIRVGALMGSAYLFTPELVDSGAAVPGFQEAAVACTRTSNLETGVGHVTRCADTTFCDEFFQRRIALLQERATPEDIREELEKLNLGRLRIAAKGQDRRGPAGEVTAISPEEQARAGMFMIGQVATLRNERISIRELHEGFSLGSLEILEAAQNVPEQRAFTPQPADIAIIGVGTLVPGAQDAESFWENLLNLKGAIREIPLERWDWRLYYDEDRRKPDRIYSRWGGFLDEVGFDPLSFGIPPKSLKSIDPLQLLALEVVRRALADAGLTKAEYEREDTSVILGASGGLGDLGLQYGVRSELLRFVDQLPDDVWKRLPEWTEESFAGTLLNVIAGRIANRFNFGGVNFTVDAACASSLAAVNLAVNELVEGRSYIAVAGGVDTVQSPFGYMCFSKTQALSPKGKARTFDENSDGIVISEGLATIVLKRLADAERDGDRIYAVIKAVGGSSDGKALGLTAPLPKGQMRALRRAYTRAGFSPATLGLIEAHGTGTVVGDRAEAETIIGILSEANAAPKSCAIGSLKTLLGHTKATAGVAGLIKVALSLYHQVLPGHAGVEKPLDIIRNDHSPVYLLQASRPWFKPANHPRRAAASSFGFGGTNFHAVLEEYTNGYQPRQGALGASAWPGELLVLGGSDVHQLLDGLRKLLGALTAGAKPPLRDLAYSLAIQASAVPRQAARLAVVATDIADLRDKLEEARKLLENGSPCPPVGDIHFRIGAAAPGKTAFLFPGQGSQYPNMCRELALYIPEFRQALEQADELFSSNSADSLLTRIYPPAAFTAAAKQTQSDELTDTKIAQPAIGAISTACLDFVTRLGFQADMLAGHSYGEYTALHAAGYLDRESFCRLSAIRGRTMAQAFGEGAKSGMAAVNALRDEVNAAIKDFPGLVVANHNATRQVVISGPGEAIDAAIAAFTAKGVYARRLPVAGAFHSPLVTNAQATLSSAIMATDFHSPVLPVYGNRDGQVYPESAETVRDILCGHMLSPVEFVGQLHAMHDAGARVFVEVGPKSALCGLTEQTLEGRDFNTIALDSMSGSLRGCLTSLAKLYAIGVSWSPAALFEGRECQSLNLRNIEGDWVRAEPGKSVWIVTGGGVRAPGETVTMTGTIPTLTFEQVREAQDAGSRNPDPVSLQAPVSSATAAAAFGPASGGSPFAATLVPPSYNETRDTAYPPNSPVQPAIHSPAGDPGGILAGYHQTMQEFLRVQENIILRYCGLLNGNSLQQSAATTIAASVPVPVPVPEPAAVCATAPIAPAVPVQPLAAPSTAHSAISANAPAAADVPRAGVVAAASGAPDRMVLQRILLEVISDRTGYPEDMLGLDLDLEAELGIDSIKRVEILGALQQRLPEAVTRGMQAQMEVLTKLKTLTALLDALAASGAEAAALMPGAAVAQPATATSGSAVAPAPGAPDRAALQPILLEVISDRTGYPEDMLGLDLDLEAELGIDSIKRVEILGALQQRLPEAVTRGMQAQMEVLTKLKTLTALLDALVASNARTAVPAPGLTPQPRSDDVSVVAGSTRKAIEGSSLPTFRMCGEVQPLAAQAVLPMGLILVTGTGPLARELCEKLRSAGAKPELVEPDTLHDRNKLEAWLAAQRQSHGTVRGLIHLNTLDHADWPAEFDSWRELAQHQVKDFFGLMQACLPDFRKGFNGSASRIMAATVIDGQFGRSGKAKDTNPLGGAITGLLKTLAWEVPGVHVRMLDFSPTLAADTLLHAICAEYCAEHDDIEIGYDGFKRVVYRPQQIVHDYSRPPLAPDSSWVVLVTGGARGITNHIAREVLRPGMHFVIVGRTPPPTEEIAATAAFRDEDRAAFRAHFLAAAKAAGHKTTPAEVESKIDSLLRDRAIRSNLRELPRVGVSCEYHACDVMDPEQFGTLIDSIYERFGRIDAVFHGAGRNEDKLIEDKSAASFARIFDTKADSSFILSQHLRPDSLRLLVFFTSVAGRFGNRGQVDYAAANEVVNRIAWVLSARWPDTRVSALNWGPWDNTGMVTEEIKRQFMERGIEAITPEQGRRWIAGMLDHGSPADVELVIGAGPWATMTGASMASMAPHRSRLMLIDEVPSVKSNGSFVLTHCFSASNDPYLLDHRLDGNLVLPVTGAAEWFAQVVQAGWPDWQVAEVRNLSVLKGFTFGINETRIASFTARPSSHANTDELHVSVEMRDNDKQSMHYRGTVVLRRELPKAPVPQGFQLLDAAEAVSAARAYSDFLFHGPSFQLICDSVNVGERGVDAHAHPSKPGTWLGGERGDDAHSWLFDPGLLDTAPQLAIVWSRMQFDETALPSRIGGIRRFGGWTPNGSFKVALRIDPSSSESIFKYDVDFILHDGTIALQMEGVESSRSAQLNRLAGQNGY